MKNLEPTYLRYVHDSLQKGSLSADNAANLPLGFVGLYETVFDAADNAKERQQLLEQFALWSLLKKAVSINLVAQVLKMTLLLLRYRHQVSFE